ncbi:MAG: helix-turn-helix transcriptional regulator [Clostridia bacterium]|nr:helix-turn-helix transcriptional regulator [Clostridia bacterium]MBQ8398566.1 helix-turn-helix transcriptional regulator [Clostridia bacterium]
MELKHKLKELRTARNMTQEAVAEHLGVSAQTVSKWERGLLCPDITLLPKIALLFKCSIDSLFDMELAWSIEHRREFEEQIRTLHAQKDWEGVYRAWIREIELNPDHYGNYPDVMLHVYRKKLYKKEYVEKMISLAEHAEKCCPDDDKRNEIYRIMLQLCAESNDPAIKEKGKYYYKKLPSLRHSREIYAKFVMEGEEYRRQLLKNIIYEIDGAECAIRQLITPEMSPEEQLFYYKKAAALYETVLDGKYAGFYDPPLLCDYAEIATLYVRLGQPNMAESYIEHILEALNKHLIDTERKNTSKLLYATSLRGAATPEQLCQKLLQNMLNTPELAQFKDQISSMQKQYNNYISQKEGTNDEK